MLDLAGGNLDVEFTGTDRSDEIGDFARAFRSFKTAALEKIELEKRSEEHRRQIEIQRAAGEARVMEDFNSAVGGLVSAAMIGDFSQHVPLDGKQGALRDLTENLNAM